MISKITIFLSIASFLWAQDPVTWTKNIISDQLEKAKKNVVIDIDLDGDLDIVCTANPEGSGAEDDAKDNVVLYLNDGSETFSAKTIDSKFRSARGLASADLNGDGYPDVVVGSKNVDSALVWYENPGSGYESEWYERSIGSGAPYNYAIVVSDLDGDGNMDIVDGIGDAAAGGSSADDYIRWLESDGASTPSFTVHNLINYASPSGIAVGDFDGDSDKDIVGMSWLSYTNPSPATDEDVRWWANDGSMSFSQQEVIKTSYGGNDAYTSDMDNDSDIDILGAGWKAQTIDWWANDGSGSFGSSIHTVKTSFKYSRNAVAVDVDSDGDKDIVACADNDNTVSWFENDGTQNFSEHQITTSFTYAYYVSGSDLDGDGDMDIIGTAQDEDGGSGTAGQLAWWESDLAEEKSIASGDPAAESFNNSKVLIDYANGYSGGTTSVFYNHNTNANKTVLGSGIHHIAAKGYYTIVTDASTYSASIDFYYNGIAEWSAISDENDLILCYWNASAGSNGQWDILKPSNQTVNTVDHKITVTGVDAELIKYSLFTLGSSTSDNSLPVELVFFRARVKEATIQLSWSTAAEIDNQGFEIWRSSESSQEKVLLSSYKSNPELEGLYNSTTGQDYLFVDQNVFPGEVYEYTLFEVSSNGVRSEMARTEATIKAGDLTRVVDGIFPKSMELNQNYPNPFNGYTIIEFKVPESKTDHIQNVRLQVFDALGQRVKTLFKGSAVPGTYIYRWDGKNELNSSVTSGTYFYRLIINGVPLTKKMQYIK